MQSKTTNFANSEYRKNLFQLKFNTFIYNLNERKCFNLSISNLKPN